MAKDANLLQQVKGELTNEKQNQINIINSSSVLNSTGTKTKC